MNFFAHQKSQDLACLLAGFPFCCTSDTKWNIYLSYCQAFQPYHLLFTLSVRPAISVHLSRHREWFPTIHSSIHLSFYISIRLQPRLNHDCKKDIATSAPRNEKPKYNCNTGETCIRTDRRVMWNIFDSTFWPMFVW